MIKHIKISFLLLLLCSLNLFAKENLSIKVLSIDAKKVKLEVVNTSTQKVIFQFISVEKAEDGKWSIVRGTITCPCQARCAKRVFRPKVNESLYFEWDREDSYCPKMYGKFRFRITKYLDTATILGYSETFELKRDTNESEIIKQFESQ